MGSGGSRAPLRATRRSSEQVQLLLDEDHAEMWGFAAMLNPSAGLVPLATSVPEADMPEMSKVLRKTRSEI